MSSPTLSAPVVVELPALGPHVAVLRSLAAQLASTLNCPIDEIDDIKIATGEAVSLLTESAPEGATLRTEFSLLGQVFSVNLSVAGVSSIDHDSFAWTLLEAVTDEVRTSHGDAFTIAFTKRSSLGEEGA